MPSTESSSKPVDLCLVQPSFSGERFMIFLPVFVTMTAVSALLFFLFADSSYGIQLASLVGYTSAVVLYTFSANRGLPRYMFSCPIVRVQLHRLAKRHIAFVSVLLVFLTVALDLRQYLPPWWLVASGAPRGLPPLTDALFVLSALLALTQILTNRSILARAHREHADVNSK
jgi:hypothetical protein